ncbi:Rne/Rng family ribonuclease [Arthrobacter sp. KK5.5]|uniref:Rne/Rng family ribonuclease n=1 Tax=Arthrobacter sp. KK5.5 TaxID=3373084 RepID=UPI003EE57531
METTNEELNETPATAVAEDAPKKRAPRKRTAPKKADDDAGASGIQMPAAEATAPGAVPSSTEEGAPGEPVVAKRAPRRRTAAKKPVEAEGPAAPTAATDVPAAGAPPEESTESPVKPVRRRASRAKKTEEAIPAAAVEAPAGEAESVVAVGSAEASAEEAVPAEPAPAKATRTRKAPVRRTKKSTDEPAEMPASADAGVPAADAAASGRAVENAGSSSTDAVEATEPSSGAADPFAVPESPMSLLFHAPDLTAVVAPTRPRSAEPAGADAAPTEDDSEERSGGRRSRRGRGRAREEGIETPAPEAQDQEQDENGTEGDGVVSRRRRRRRRGDADLELTGGQDDDPPNTVTRVRGPRAAAPEPAPSNKVTSVKGSTRLEAKRQRRRESRETGRRRHVITEAEFLARRESVDRQMIVRQREDRIQIGVLEDGILAEHFVSKTQQDSLIGNVYVGKVQNVLPSMEAAFVDIGRGRNAVLYAGEVNWDVAGLDGQPRRIEHALKSGDSVLVQVTKDPVGHKGARLTSQISLPGRYLVYVPGGSMTGISRKLPDVERNRLKKILKDHLPENAGVIVRTAAEGASEQELMNDINRLRAQWESIEAKSTSTKTAPPELLYGEPDLTIKVVRDVFNEDFSKLIVSGEEAWDTIEAYVTYVAPDLLSRLEQWTSDEDIFTANRLDEQIHKALERKVFLPSGGSLVIDRTEAMTVVDVNTGKFTGSGGNLEETVTKNNLEAAEEIVRQLRLRDIGGIIVIDFIDMVLEANRDLVLRRMVECLGRDRTKHQVAEVTSLGLVQMTRKRMGTGLLEVFSENCEACNGRGVVTHEEPVEHRRSFPSQGEAPAGPRNDRAPRQERRRRRGQDKDQDTGAEVQHAPTPAPEDPERAAKATAARAAFASIAAAAQAAHEHEANHGTEQEAAVEPLPSAAGTAEPVDAGQGEQDEDQVLRIAGEEVRLPRSRRRRRASSPEQAPSLTLESLSAAFGASADSSEGHAAGSAPPESSTPAPREESAASERPRRNRRSSGNRGAAPETTPETNPRPAVSGVAGQSVAPVETEPPAVSEPAEARRPSVATELAQPQERPRRPRRNRSARSAQGAGDTPIENTSTDGSRTSAAVGSAHVARLSDENVAAPSDGEGTGPLVLGVGVPASEL